jgi:hypothetical protein
VAFASKFSDARSAGLKGRFGGSVGGGPSITMDPSGAQLAAGMESWARLVDDFGPAWSSATKLIHRHNARTFQTRGAGTGDRKRWGVLTPRYKAWKARRFPGRGLLVRTNALRSALTGRGSGSRVEQTKSSLEVGARGEVSEIGGYHQTGTKHMIARPPVKFGRDVRQKDSLAYVVSQMLQTVIVDARKKALGVDAGVMKVSRDDKRGASLERLSRIKTR